VPQQLERQARILQAGRPERIDVHEAYIDAVMINIYGGRGSARVWIDELQVAGFVETKATARQDRAVRPAAHAEAAGRAGREVKLRGGELSIDGRPFFPRLIEHRGEPLLKLKQLGFNGVKLFEHPGGALLAEAADAGMWIVCPPPPLASGAPVGRQYEPVLAWNVGDDLAQQDLPAVEATVRMLRSADREIRRPIIGNAVCELSAFSELADVILMGRQVIGTSLELSDLATWHQQRARLLRPGATTWAWIQTQADPDAMAQAAALAAHPISGGVRHSSLRQLALMAVATGIRGLVFQSHTPLDGDAPETAERAASLKLLNLELSLVESWAAAGSFVTPATSSDPSITATVLQTDRARLLLPLRFARGDQHALDEGRGGEVTFVVPGVPESNEVFELTAAGLRPAPRRRVAGGVSVTLRDLPPAALIVLTQDAQVIDSLTRAAGQQRRSAADLSRRVTAAELAEVDAIERRLAGQAAPAGLPREWLSNAKARLDLADKAMAGGDDPQGLRLCREVQHWLGLLRRARWTELAGPQTSSATLPLAADYTTLPECARLLSGLKTVTGGDNLLPGGDLEDLDTLRSAGWRHTQLAQRRVVSDVGLSKDGPHGGAHCLRLRAMPQLDQKAPSLLEAPPAWIATPPLALPPGAVVEIRGFVRVPRPIVGSVDGLLIVDSLGGDALAERVGQTSGWQQFTLYRAAPRGGNLIVTFALSGIGEALVDDVTVRPIRLPGPQPAEARARAEAAGLPLRTSWQ
jgi:hypothetical protein